MKTNITEHSLYGLKVSSFTSSDLISEFTQTITNKNKITCYGHSLTGIPRFRSYPQIYRISQTFDIMVADGKGFYLLCRAFAIPLQSDMAIYEISDLLLGLANKMNYSVLFLGSDTTSNNSAADRIREKYPNAKILKGHHGYFSEKEEASIVDYLNKMHPDILLIGMSSPKKEEFFDRNADKIDARVIVLIGGVIDIYAGKTRKIPKYIKVLCLTWIYRFIQEPRRLRSLFTGGIGILVKLVPKMLWSRFFACKDDFTISSYIGIEENEACD